MAITEVKNEYENQPLSRYNRIKLLLSSDDIPIQETWDTLDIPVLETDQYIKVPAKYEHRPDLISEEYYGTQYLYWIIAYANNMVDPFAETIIGKLLRIPDPENVYLTILAK